MVESVLGTIQKALYLKELKEKKEEFQCLKGNGAGGSADAAAGAAEPLQLCPSHS